MLYQTYTPSELQLGCNIYTKFALLLNDRKNKKSEFEAGKVEIGDEVMARKYGSEETWNEGKREGNVFVEVKAKNCEIM